VEGIRPDTAFELLLVDEEPATRDIAADALDSKPGRVSLIPQPDDLAVSYVLNPDRTLPIFNE
jgi:hypothetical protein